MARKPRQPKASIEPNPFVEALKFCSVVLSDKGTPNETHILLNNKTATAFNGILGTGHLINEEIYAAPNNKLMIDALSKCGQNLSITQLDSNRLSIKSDKFKAIVPCIDPVLLSAIQPDNPIGEINENLKLGLEAVYVLVNDNAQDIHLCSILLKANSVISTNGALLFEYWHGIDLPTLIIPKSFAQSLSNINKKLVQFGFSENSFTVWFEDNSWIKTQLFNKTWPNVDEILNKTANPFPVPSELWEGLDAVTPFSEDGLVYFDNELIRSHENDGVGASYKVTGLPKGPKFTAKNLALIKPYAKQIDFLAQGTTQNTTMLMFFGDNIRGCMLGRI